MDVGGTKLYFFPDYLFVLQNERYGAVPYDSLTAHSSTDRFIEDSSYCATRRSSGIHGSMFGRMAVQIGGLAIIDNYRLLCMGFLF